MRANEIDFFQSRYFKRRLDQTIDTQCVLEEDFHTEIIDFFNEVMSDFQEHGYVDYANTENVKLLIMEIIPESFVLQPDFSAEIYIAIQMYYEFLYEEKKLTEAEHLTMALFFQKTLFPFLKRMGTVSANEGSFNDFNQEFMRELTGLIEEDAGSTPQSPNQARSNNVIPLRPSLSPSSQAKKVPTSKFDGYVQLVVELEDFDRSIWRRVLVPYGVTYRQLHEIIQALFEWEGTLDYVFETGSELIGQGVISENDYHLDLGEERIFEGVLEQNHSFYYTYHAGKDWRHRITVEQNADTNDLPAGRDVYCLRKMRDAPLEQGTEFDLRGSSTLAEINERLARLSFDL